mmetsp:Transcript_69165/g.192545  ORF Transcript_69165/g.192545 Transcript_69165/m.192545 type:complete len:252 (+) Transcript_69165:227-982(+)
MAAATRSSSASAAWSRTWRTRAASKPRCRCIVATDSSSSTTRIVISGTAAASSAAGSPLAPGVGEPRSSRGRPRSGECGGGSLTSCCTMLWSSSMERPCCATHSKSCCMTTSAGGSGNAGAGIALALAASASRRPRAVASSWRTMAPRSSTALAWPPKASTSSSSLAALASSPFPGRGVASAGTAAAPLLHNTCNAASTFSSCCSCFWAMASRVARRLSCASTLTSTSTMDCCSSNKLLAWSSLRLVKSTS